ncbi:MAG: hypothetical protein OSJ74_09700 [Clostridia bacterium]|nr:hypothetical protein [Clostridia bacterium]
MTKLDLTVEFCCFKKRDVELTKDASAFIMILWKIWTMHSCSEKDVIG